MGFQEKLLDAAVDLVDKLDSVTDENLPSEIAEIVKSHSKGAALAGVASGWIPGLGGAALATVSAGFIWTMYAGINSKINLPFGENVTKSIASGVATNLASAVVGSIFLSTVFSIFPGAGSVVSTAIVGATCYALTLASGYIYLKVLTTFFASGVNPTQVSADAFKNAANSVASSQDVQDIMKEAKKSWERSNR